MAKIGVIGSGFSGLSAACYLAKQGHDVEVFEKNDSPGGRARTFTEKGYLFDMGPSWYWMPDVFEKFFSDFGYCTKDLYDLQLLDPAFTVVYDNNERISIPADYASLRNLFESIEPGSALQLDHFMQEAKVKYEVGIRDLVYKPCLSMREFVNRGVLSNIFRLQVFTSFTNHINKYFSNPKLTALMEFPVLFLGAMPSETPALYSLMNYAGLKLGTWYPKGGFGKVISSMVKIAEQQGVKFNYGTTVSKIVVKNNKAQGLVVDEEEYLFDGIVAAADYHHIESKLLSSEQRNYTEEYWQKKTFAPSCLIYYVGLNKRIKINHHTLFFEESLFEHSKEIYKHPQWPSKPLFYICCPSQTDATVAPIGHENLFFLMPIAPGLDDNEATREKYFRIMLARLEKLTGEEDLAAHIDFKKSYCVSDFINDYNAYNGNAYGLANTLRQTAILKPKIINKKIKNIVYAGQLTVPGPGVPPALISGNIAAKQMHHYIKSTVHEAII